LSYTSPQGAASEPLTSESESAAEIPLVRALPLGKRKTLCTNSGWPRKRRVTLLVEAKELNAHASPIFSPRLTSTKGSAPNDV